MALKDIFNLIKADRYTADGCEEIKKSQEAIAEDAGLPDGTMRHRKDGDYIKQAGKWVPAPAAKGKAGGKEKGSTAQRMKAYVDAMNKKNGEFAGKYKESKAKSDAMKQGQLAELNRASTESKPTEKKPALELPDEKSSFATDVNRMKKLKKEDYKQYTIQLEKLHSKYPINKWKDLYNKTLNDSAPRELTGDCKIRIRNSK